MNTTIKTAIFPVAGLGTRFLPVTKTGPKEMLPILDKPIIHYVVQEAIEAGIKHIVMVTSSEKRALEDYFDRNLALEACLEQQGKWEALALVKQIIPGDVSITYVRQAAPLGLGHAIYCARHVVKDEPVAVLLPDDVIDTRPKNALQQMLRIHAQYQSSVIALEEVPWADVSKYGIIDADFRGASDPNLSGIKIKRLIEKPARDLAPSRWAVIGRYILNPNIFYELGRVTAGVGGEIQLTDAISALIANEAVYGLPIHGKRYDCGEKWGMVRATIAFALKCPEMREPLENILRELMVEEPVG